MQDTDCDEDAQGGQNQDRRGSNRRVQVAGLEL
jgi:hypothetical protein